MASMTLESVLGVLRPLGAPFALVGPHAMSGSPAANYMQLENGL